MAILIYVIQGFAGYPLTSIVLKEGKRKLQEYRAGTWQPVHEQEGQETGAEPDVPKLFEKYPNDIIQIIHEFYV